MLRGPVAVSTGRDHDVTRRALADWLAGRTGAPEVVVGELAIPGLSGFSNETLIFDATWDDGDGPRAHGLVLRVEPSGHQVFPSTEFDAQVAVLRALAADGTVPVPAVLWFEEDRTILGDRFIAMPRIEGQVPADNPSYHAAGWLAEATPELRRGVWTSGIDVMAAIHRVDRQAAGLGWITPVSPEAQLQRDLDYRSFAVGDHPYPLLDRAFERLAATVPPPVPPALCWGDARIGNMIFAADGSVAAVLDWEMVTAGDPVQDLAWYLLLDRHHHEAFDVPRLEGLPERAESVARWEAASGHSAAHLDWYELLGGARYAAIMTRVLHLLEESEILPGAAAMAYDNTGSQLLERLLDERA
jgi:aminoglycoside phosphotransferase (APT) family kinase protein